MKQCSRCHGKVPQGALACMHCGAEFTDTAQYQVGSVITGILALVGIVLWIMSFYYWD
jgi:uncharacterized membrane protein YvbJ